MKTAGGARRRSPPPPEQRSRRRPARLLTRDVATSDLESDYCLLVRSHTIADDVRELGKDRDEDLRSRGQSRESDSSVPLSSALEAASRNARIVIDGRKNPIRVKELAEALIQIIVEETRAGIEPSRGTFHEWTSETRERFKSGNRFYLSFPKLLIALAQGLTWQFLPTGREAELHAFIETAMPGSMTLHELFRQSYRINRGDLYLTLLTIENVLSRQWENPERDALRATQSLSPITNHYENRGDKFGAWYHLFGVMLYGYVHGGINAWLVGGVESFGSHILSNDSEKQEDAINAKGGFVGARLRDALEDGALATAADDPARLDPTRYLALDEDFRDRIYVSNHPGLTARLKRDGSVTWLTLSNAGGPLFRCTTEIIPDLGYGLDTREKLVRKNVTILAGKEFSLPLYMQRTPRSVRVFFDHCARGEVAQGPEATPARGPASSDRETADREAKREFMELHFYAEGGGMHLVPGIMDFYEDFVSRFGRANGEKLFKYRWGLNVVDHRPIGLYSVRTGNRNHRVGVLGCVGCHSSRAAGVFVPGLGNKNIDVSRIGQSALETAELWRRVLPEWLLTPEEIKIRDSAIAFATDLAQEQFGNLTQGLVPTAFIRRWFYRVAGMDMPTDTHRGAGKVPALWGYGQKREVGQFSDGLGDGSLPGWAVAVELTAGQKPEVVRGYREKIEHAENLFNDFLPPKYPRSIALRRTQNGERMFLSTCARCHGTYQRDAQGLPIYEKPRWIPIAAVGTDTDRLDSNDETFYRLVEINPLNDILRALKPGGDGRGYFAQRLVGIWSRFPYLHNASVPSIRALLTPPEQRPQAFDLKDAGEASRFDEAALGLTVPEAGSRAARKLFRRGQDGDRDVYFTGRIGQSNRGHPFGAELPAVDRDDLIEYLKTL